LGLIRRARDLLLSHAGIVLEVERGERAALAAAITDEAHDGADIGSAAGERFHLRARIEILPLDADGRHGAQPPVIGGKNATSFAPAMEASLRTCIRSSAARTPAGLSNARA